jgi:hypothetical protein
MARRLASEAWTDEDILTILDLVEGERLSMSVIAARLRVSRSAIAGIVHRVRTDLARVPDRAAKRENCDGGMPRGWWKRGRA